MAVPTVDAPTVQQSGAPLGINPPAEAFGATVGGQGLGAIGGAEAQTSDMLEKHALAYQQINNKAEADQGWQANVNQTNQAYVDYQQQFKHTLSQQGLNAALATFPDFLKTTEDNRAAIGNGLSNPMAKAMYDEDSRRVTANVVGEAARFVGDQRQKFVVSQAKGTQSTLIEQLEGDTTKWKDPAWIQKFAEAQGQMDQVSGISQEEGSVNLQIALGHAAANAALGIEAKSGVTAAVAFLNDPDVKNSIAPSVYNETMRQLAPAFRANQASASADALVDSLVAGVHASGAVPSLTTLKTAAGLAFKVNSAYADKFSGFIKDLEATGFQIRSIGGYATRNIAGTDVGSYHGAGAAIDIDPAQNPVNGTTSDLPANIGVLAAKWGLGWGGNWQDKKDPMHFSIARSEGGSVDIPHPDAFTGNGALSSYAIKALQAPLMAAIDSQAEKEYPGDITYRNWMEQRGIQRLDRLAQAAENNESEAYMNASAKITASGIVHNDPASIIQVVGLATWNALPPVKQNALIAQVKTESQGWSLERGQLMQQLDAERAQAAKGLNDAFLKEDLTALPLPLGVAASYMKDKADIQAGRYVASAKDTAFNQAWHSEPVRSALEQQKIQPGSLEEHQLAGLLHGEISFWTDNTGKPPQPKEIQTDILPKVWLAYGKNPQVATLSPTSLNYAKRTLAIPTTAGGPGNTNPTDLEIAQEAAYNRREAISILHSQGNLRPSERDITDVIDQATRHQESQAGIKSPTNAN